MNSGMNYQRPLAICALVMALLAACSATTVPSAPPAAQATPSATATTPVAAATPSATATTPASAASAATTAATTPPPAATSPPATAASGAASETATSSIFVPGAPASAAVLPPVSPLPAPDLQFDGQAAFGHIEAQMQYIPRHTGTPGWQQTGDYIIAQVQAAGWTVEEQRFDYNGVEVRNIIAKRGQGPLLLLGAHYDTRIYADEDPDPARRRDPVPGANDGASGVAVLLELARHIDTEQLGREVWLTFFDAEDNGRIEGWEWIVGSTYLAANLPRQPEAMILVDLVGDADLQLFYERNSDPDLSQSIWQTGTELGYEQFIPEPKFSVLDDHTPFLRRGVPAVDLIDFDYPYWHTVADTTDKVSAESLEVVGRTLERWLDTRLKSDT